MCGGGGSNKAAKQARKDEQERQATIRNGTARINSIFDGADTTVGTGVVDPSKYAEGATYYQANGMPYVYHAKSSGPTKPISVGGLSIPASAPMPSQLFSGTSTTHTNGFDDTFFNGRRQAYLDYATPQLNDQYGTAQKELAFALDRSGLLDSSVRAQKEGELQKTYDTNRRGVEDQAQSFVNTAKSNIEDARSNLITTLNATGDATGAAQSAISRAAALSAPDTYSPLGQMFTTFVNGLNAYKGGAQTAAVTGTNPYSTSLFGSTKNAVVTSS